MIGGRIMIGGIHTYSVTELNAFDMQSIESLGMFAF